MAGTDLFDRLQLGDHVCALAGGTDDGLDLMAAVIAAGLAAGDQVMVFTEAPPERLARRHAAVGAARRSGQVRMISAREGYLPDGRFEPDRMLGALRAHVTRAAEAGYPGLRLVGDMSWVLDGPAGVELLAAYEAQVNRVYLEGRALGVCVYDRHALDQGLLRQVACAHPATIAAGRPDDWAPLLRIRRTADPYGLRLAGEADFTTAEALATALEAVLEQQPDPAVPIHLDLAGLHFADAATAALIGRASRRAPAGVHVLGCHGAVETVLDRLGVIDLSGRSQPG